MTIPLTWLLSFQPRRRKERLEFLAMFLRAHDAMARSWN